MTWQDLVFSVGGILFMIALLPALWGSKPPKSTCAMTGATLTAFTLCYGTLGLTYACVTTALTSLLWFLLLVQQLRAKSAKVWPTTS